MKTVANSSDYSATGDVRKMMLGNGLWETAQFNERLQLTQIGLGTTPTNNNQFKIDYEYGELGTNDLEFGNEYLPIFDAGRLNLRF